MTFVPYYIASENGAPVFRKISTLSDGKMAVRMSVLNVFIVLAATFLGACALTIRLPRKNVLPLEHFKNVGTRVISSHIMNTLTIHVLYYNFEFIFGLSRIFIFNQHAYYQKNMVLIL